MKTPKTWNRFTKQKISEIWTPICQPLGIGTTTFGSLPPSGMESNFLMCDKAMLYCGIQYMSRSCSWTLIQKHSPSDFEVLRTQINPISRTDISHKSCADFVLPLHENHADLKPLSWQQKQLRDPDNYGISCMLWTWQQLSVRKNCGIVRRSRLSAYA